MAEVVSFDREKDIAIIKIHASRPLQVMPLGTSSDLMLGETVLALGNAYGYEHSVTAGIISSLSRDVEVNEKQSYENLIQTDASINPGNSGGPLVNLDGEVIGINVAIRAGAQRIGFAIPIDDARRIIAKLLCIEQIDGTWHGVVAEDVKTAETQSLRVRRIQPDSPAGKAGLVPGDVILKAGTLDIADGVDWERALLGRRAGETVPVLVERGGKPMKLDLVLTSAKTRGVPSIAQSVVPVAVDHPVHDKTWTLLGMNLVQARRAKLDPPGFAVSRRDADYRHPPRQSRGEQRPPRRRHSGGPAHLGNGQRRECFLRPRPSRPGQILAAQVLHPPRRRNLVRPSASARPANQPAQLRKSIPFPNNPRSEHAREGLSAALFVFVVRFSVLGEPSRVGGRVDDSTPAAERRLFAGSPGLLTSPDLMKLGSFLSNLSSGFHFRCFGPFGSGNPLQVRIWPLEWIGKVI